jgi:hypothetical protein
VVRSMGTARLRSSEEVSATLNASSTAIDELQVTSRPFESRTDRASPMLVDPPTALLAQPVVGAPLGTGEQMEAV